MWLVWNGTSSHLYGRVLVGVLALFVPCWMFWGCLECHEDSPLFNVVQRPLPQEGSLWSCIPLPDWICGGWKVVSRKSLETLRARTITANWEPIASHIKTVPQMCLVKPVKLEGFWCMTLHQSSQSFQPLTPLRSKQAKSREIRNNGITVPTNIPEPWRCN